jgi:hypothetical protein
MGRSLKRHIILMIYCTINTYLLNTLMQLLLFKVKERILVASLIGIRMNNFIISLFVLISREIACKQQCFGYYLNFAGKWRLIC